MTNTSLQQTPDPSKRIFWPDRRENEIAVRICYGTPPSGDGIGTSYRLPACRE